MNRKKVDNRIRILIENGVAERQRSLFVVVGDRGKDQVVILHHMLSKATVKARPSVLWCYKKELGFSSHRKKRMRQLQKKIKSGTLNLKQDDPFELFVAATNIRYCYYNETHKILGNTFGMCVLQDFEALTPNLLARTVETVEGGGLVVILLRTMNSLKQLYTMTMDCLNITRIVSGCPLPEACELYYVNRDTLFCYHKASEVFLQRLMALYVASHYKNSPNDLQMLSDAPAHHLFCLLPPVPPTQNALPEVLAVVQVCLEGEISRQSILNSLSRGKKASGDLIPWTVSEQFQDPDFGGLSGGRVVRIAVHPDYQGMGYGSRALQLLQMYYEGKFPCLEEKVLETPQEIRTVSSEAVSLLEEVITPRKDLPPLLLKLNERPAERLDYLGVSYGLTPRLLKFWKRAGFVPEHHSEQERSQVSPARACKVTLEKE